MKSPVLTEHLSVERVPLFIADSEGVFAAEIASLLSQEFLPVILTKTVLDSKMTPRAIVIHYRSRVPKIPDNAFQAICFVQSENDFSSGLFRILLREAERRGVQFIFIAPRRFIEKKVAQQVMSYKLGTVLLYGDVIDDPSMTNPAAVIVSHAREKREIVIADQGLQKIFPVSKQFIIDSIVRYSIVEKTEHQCIALSPSGDFYELSLARILQQIDSQLPIHFSRKKKAVEYAGLPNGAAIASESDISLRESLKHALAMPKQQVAGRKHHDHHFPSVFRYFYLGFFSILLFLVLALFLTGGMAFFGERFLVRSMRLLSEMRFSEAKQQAEFAKSAFIVSSSSLKIMSPIFKAVLFEKPVFDLEKKLKTGEKGAELLAEAADGTAVYQKLFMTNSTIKKEEFSQATQRIKNALLTLSQLSVEGSLPKEYKKMLSENKKSIDLFLAVSDVLPDIFGFGKEKRYLVLFQNNNELRPGGGFIGSFAVVSVKEGKFGDIKIQDVYDADGQLKGHVEPPPALKKYLGATHWYLRDSNFSPDFPESAGNAAFFLTLETGDKVDGVVAIDTSILEGILRVLGPLQLPNSQKEATDKNVVELTQAGAEKDFFPGSTQKKDFLNELYHALRMKLGAERGKSGILLQVLSAGLMQKHILTTFVDSKLSLPFALQGVSSTLESHRKTSNTMAGFFGINEANLGTNKVNKYIERSFAYDLALSESGEIETEATVTLKNTSGKGSPYGGDYKAYVRFLLPESVSPEEISVDGVSQVVLAPLEATARSARGAVAANTLEVERIDVKGKSTYGFFLTVPVQSKKVLVIRYKQLQESKESVGKYALTLFKQPGTGPDPYVFSLSLPTDYALLSSNIILKKEETRYVALSRLTGDQEIEISYGKK